MKIEAESPFYLRTFVTFLPYTVSTIFFLPEIETPRHARSLARSRERDDSQFVILFQAITRLPRIPSAYSTYTEAEVHPRPTKGFVD